MPESLSITHTLAALIGLYLLAAGIGLLRDSSGVAAMFNTLRGNPLLGYFGAVMAFAIGGAIVAVHNDWSTWLSSIVSFFGWVALLEGVVMLIAREPFIEAVGQNATSDRFVKGMGVVATVGGAILLWCGLA